MEFCSGDLLALAASEAFQEGDPEAEVVITSMLKAFALEHFL